MKCKFCKRELKNPTAVKLGYGPVCGRKNVIQIRLKPNDYEPIKNISYCNICKMDTETEDNERCEICLSIKE